MMEAEKQSGVPPSRPPPPGFSGAAPPYMDPQGGMYPMGQPGGAVPYGAPPPSYYTPPPNQVGYPPPPVGGYQMPPQGYPQGPPQGAPQGYPPQGALQGYPPQGAPQGYPPQGAPQGYPPQGAPQGYPGGQPLYPDVSQLPQPQAVPLGFGSPGGGGQAPPGSYQGPPPGVAPTGPPSFVPVRPAPCPPGYNPSAPFQEGGGAPTPQEGQVPWWANLKDGEAPPGCVVSWKGGDGLKIYYIQEEGHIVSPKKPLQMAVYKKINGKGSVVEESLVGMVEVLGCWRLRLHGKTTFTLHTYTDTYIFLDDSTCPSKSGRFVIIELPADVSKTMRADLFALLQELTDMREEQEGVVGKIATNVETVYTDITKKINVAVKDAVPGAHKSTKWLRKGTGSLVRMGGTLVSKGMHLIADQMPANQAEPEEESPIHTELMDALTNFRKSMEDGSINYV